MRTAKWTALYMPATSKPDPSKYDCASREEAEQHVVDHMCKDCRDERSRVLNGTSDPSDEVEDSAHPACFCEWEVLLTRDFRRCQSFGDVMKAVGAKVIYRKGEI